MISLHALTPVATIKVGASPEEIHAMADGSAAVLVNWFAKSLMMIDAARHAMIEMLDIYATGPRLRSISVAGRKLMRLIALAALVLAVAGPALAAEKAWDEIRVLLYGEQLLLSGNGVIAIDAPYRTVNDSRTELGARVAAPEGTALSEVTLVLDENPMPVSAVFRFAEPMPRFHFDVTMRLNGPTPMHVVARTADGRLFVSETFVKTTGQGACAAPPGTDPELALATLGKMQIELVGRVSTLADGLRPLDPGALLNTLDVAIDHPSHSGMQMNQMTLLFTPMRYVETLKIDLDGAGYLEMTGSISLSENPKVGITIPARAGSVEVTMTDTDGTVSKAQQSLTGY